MQLATLVGLRQINWFQIFFFEPHATLINVFLLGSSSLLASLPALLHLQSLLFRQNVGSTALLTLLLHFEQGRYLSYVCEYAGFPIAFLVLTVLSTISIIIILLCKVSWKKKSNNETSVVVVETTPSKWRIWKKKKSSSHEIKEDLLKEYASLQQFLRDYSFSLED